MRDIDIYIYNFFTITKENNFMLQICGDTKYNNAHEAARRKRQIRGRGRLK